MTEQELDRVGELLRRDGASYADGVVDHVRGGALHLTVYRPGSYGARAEDVIRRWLIPPNGQVVPLFLP